MDWFDQPAPPAQPQPSSFATAPVSPGPADGPPEPSGRSVLGGTRRTIATALLAVGLLTVGGAAVVFAADPAASAAPNATTQPSAGAGGAAPGTTTRPNGGPGGGSHNAADCPNMGGSGGGGGTTTPSTPSTPTPATPSTPTAPSATPEL
jgi:hypothetical protein